MPTCHGCGNKLAKNSAFCNKCGLEVESASTADDFNRRLFSKQADHASIPVAAATAVATAYTVNTGGASAPLFQDPVSNDSHDVAERGLNAPVLNVVERAGMRAPLLETRDTVETHDRAERGPKPKRKKAKVQELKEREPWKCPSLDDVCFSGKKTKALIVCLVFCAIYGSDLYIGNMFMQESENPVSVLGWMLVGGAAIPVFMFGLLFLLNLVLKNGFTIFDNNMENGPLHLLLCSFTAHFGAIGFLLVAVYAGGDDVEHADWIYWAGGINLFGLLCYTKGVRETDY